MSRSPQIWMAWWPKTDEWGRKMYQGKYSLKNEIQRWRSCSGVPRGCVYRIRLWLLKRDDHSGVLVGAGGTRRRIPSFIKNAMASKLQFIPLCYDHQCTSSWVISAFQVMNNDGLRTCGTRGASLCLTVDRMIPGRGLRDSPSTFSAKCVILFTDLSWYRFFDLPKKHFSRNRVIEQTFCVLTFLIVGRSRNCMVLQ